MKVAIGADHGGFAIKTELVVEKLAEVFAA